MSHSKLQVRCKCQKVQGELDIPKPKSLNHIVCYCVSCQQFAHFLKRPEQILDDNNGTRIINALPKQLIITQGQEHIQLLRLNPNSKTHRWYAGCCNTAIANTSDAGTAFLGLIADSVNQEELESLYPATQPLYHCFPEKSKNKNINKDLTSKSLKVLIAKIIYQLTKGKLLKHHLPNPFFKNNNEPICQANIISKEEKANLIPNKE